MTHLPDIAGVPADVIHALGAVVVGAGRLEDSIHHLVADLGMHPGKNRTSDLIRHIRKCGSDPNGLPSHARVTGQELVEWATAAGDALRERDEAMHSVSHGVFTDGVPVPHLTHMRTKQQRPADATALLHLANQLLALSARGMKIVEGLRHSPRLGVFIPNYVVDGGWVPINDTDVGGADLARPTDDELDSWRKTYGPFPELTPN